MKRLVLVLFGLLAVGWPRVAWAQVNAEALRSTLRANPKFLWFDAGLAGRTGNTRTLTFSGAVFGGLTGGDHLAFMRASADYGEAVGVTTVSRWTAHARYNYRATEIVALEALAQVQHDRFRRMAVRDLYGAGLRFNYLNWKYLELFAGTTYLFEHERISASGPYFGENNYWHRWSNYAGVDFRATPTVDLSSVTYVQPRFNQFSDFRLLSETYVSFTITKILSARVSGSLWFDNDPPAGVLKYDLEIKNTLTIKLQ
ncbi:MAG: DUF481 domain-containing protein [Labilithrix sp.]|nr:DUF481 domain-containing protein [Labilithrix sp.]MCW5813841.1 DUF481 domain-containing protein [Labilithrix sp.]